MATHPDGAALEARVQRLFLAQGILAERGLKVIVDAKREKTATDIDVLVSEYASGFHLTRRHVECKSGSRVHPLDRVLWMRGVRQLLAADGSYFILDENDPEIALFARGLQIDMWTPRHLDQMEGALKIQNGWPCRSNHGPHRENRVEWSQREKTEPGNQWWGLLKDALRFVELESWLSPSYTKLNRMLRLLDDIGRTFKAGEAGTPAAGQSARYAVSSLLVRLTQYLVFVCFDVAILPRTDVLSYLSQRLTFGDHNPAYSRSLVDGSIRWTRASLESQGVKVPQIDVNRVMQPPAWTDSFATLISKLLDASNEVRYLPIAVEALQFDTEENVKRFQRLQSAVRAGAELASLVRGFVIQASAVPPDLLEPVLVPVPTAQAAASGQAVLSLEATEVKPRKRKVGSSMAPHGRSGPHA